MPEMAGFFSRECFSTSFGTKAKPVQLQEKDEFKSIHTVLLIRFDTIKYKKQIALALRILSLFCIFVQTPNYRPITVNVYWKIMRHGLRKCGAENDVSLMRTILA